MKICLLIPPAKGDFKIPERIYGCSYNIYPQPDLPLLYVAAALEEKGHEVLFKDFVSEEKKWHDMIEYLKKTKADAYVFHTVLLSQKLDLTTANTIRQLDKKAPIVFFGPQPTHMPDAFMKDPKHYIIRGEPEESIQQLFEELGKKNPTLSGVKGITYRQDDKTVHNESYGTIKDINNIPFPARHFIGHIKHKFYNPKLSKRPMTVMLTSRGCPYRCYFCVPNSLSWARELEWKKDKKGTKPPIGIRSAENIVAEFKEIKRLGYRSVSIIDDMFLVGGKQRILDICKGIAPLKMEFGILARADHANDIEILRALKRAGCRYIDLGVESFNEKILKYIRKDLDPKIIPPCIRKIRQAGMEPKINIMFGTCPLDSKEEIKKTIKKVCELPVDYCMFSITTPFPGTEIEQVALEKGWVVKSKYKKMLKELDPSKSALLSYKHLTNKDLEKLTKYANRRFYLRPSRILRQLKRIKSWSDLTDTLKGGLQLIKGKN
ncbi:B12-binding domain-containing radical SAM protein [Candidatus Woesearchaeota archaeon]|nr:B12-binding domain-containing radical SAM protein [Candidatus Woesearchaeota archaeon]